MESLHQFLHFSHQADFSLLSEEDAFGSYSRILLKYYLAEGIMCKQSVFLASADVEPENIIKVIAIRDGPNQLNYLLVFGAIFKWATCKNTGILRRDFDNCCMLKHDTVGQIIEIG